MTNRELIKEFISLDLQIGGQHDGYLTIQEDDAKDCAKIAIDFAIEELENSLKNAKGYAVNPLHQQHIQSQINELKKQKEEL